MKDFRELIFSLLVDVIRGTKRFLIFSVRNNIQLSFVEKYNHHIRIIYQYDFYHKILIFVKKTMRKKQRF